MEHAHRPSYRQIPTGTSASAASGCRTGFGIAASAPASDYHEETPEREERLARRVARVSLRHALTIGGFERGLFRLIQHVKIARQPGPLGPLLHRILAFEHLEIFGFPDVDRVRPRREEIVIIGRLMHRRRRHEMRDLAAPRSGESGFADQKMRGRREIARHLRENSARLDPLHQRWKQRGMIGQPMQRRVGINQIVSVLRSPRGKILMQPLDSGAALRPASTISLDPSTPTTRASGHRSFSNLDTLPVPAPRSATVRTGNSGMRINRSTAGRSRWPENFRYCCGFHTIVVPIVIVAPGCLYVRAGGHSSASPVRACP